MKRNISLILMSVILVISCGFLSVSQVLVFGDTNTEVEYKNDHLFELQEPMNEKMADYAINLLKKINENYLTDNNCYFVLIPDKYMYLCDKKSDYEQYYDYLSENLSFVDFIEVYDLIESDDYYFTDMHLRQEKSIDVMKRISESMNNDFESDFEKITVDTAFCGDYYDDYKKKAEPESFCYLTNDTIENLTTKEDIPIYDFEKLETDKPYEFFLSGNQSIVTIKNEKAESDKRLVIFRDSFSSSLSVLLSQNYSEIVLVDMRYIMSDIVGDYVSFENADVLFMYSTTLINNSLCMR